jgi:hypothetical protein
VGSRTNLSIFWPARKVGVQPVGPPRSHMILLTYRHFLRAARGLRPALGPSRLPRCGAPRPASQERDPEHPPDPGRRATGAAPASRESPSSPSRLIAQISAQISSTTPTEMTSDNANARPNAVTSCTMTFMPRPLDNGAPLQLSSRYRDNATDSTLAPPPIKPKGPRAEISRSGQGFRSGSAIGRSPAPPSTRR